LGGDRELIIFVQRMLGYSLTGSIRDHALFFLHGTDGNGKGVFLNTWHGIMGDYATIAPMETFTASKNERHPTDLAMLRGARVVMAQETEDGQRWAESKIKALTGGDPVTARFMRQDFFTYQPQFKLLIAGNHKPSLRNVDEAVRRRLNLVPFTITIPEEERDTELSAKLKSEWPGILAWAIQGCLTWQRDGLQPPNAVKSATDNYLAEEDALGRFLEERCQPCGFDEYVEVKELYASWRDWCSNTGEFAGTIKRFSQNLQARHFRRMQHPINRRACISGLRLMIQGTGLSGNDLAVTEF
jgi:putative DNA primase/helicase